MPIFSSFMFEFQWMTLCTRFSISRSLGIFTVWLYLTESLFSTVLTPGTADAAISAWRRDG
jgi:hypothetical protein